MRPNTGPGFWGAGGARRSRLATRLLGALTLVPLAVACSDVQPGTPGEEVEELSLPVVVSDPSVPLAITLPSAADPMFAGLTIPADAATRGMWSPTRAWPLNGLHSVLLPNGRVLTYGTPSGNAATQDGRTFDVWDPAQGFGTVSHQTSFRADQVNSFCSSATFLDDGRLLVSGGNSPLDSTLFTASTSTSATSTFRMADDRWYGTLITLPDGRALMMGGSAPYAALRGFEDPVGAINGGTVSMTPELFDPATGWRSLFGAYSRDAFGPDANRYWYPRAWTTAQGVFGISSEKMWYLNAAGDGSIRTAANFKTGVNSTTRPNIGPTSSAVMYAPGRVLQVGGNGYHDGHATPASALATIIDVNGANPVLSETAPMSFPRHWPSATVLLNGSVVVTGGTRFANNGGADAVYEAELWNPATGTWTVGARAAQIRVYHSAAILMPNGTVLSTGGGAPGPVNNLNAEVYYPPHLFRAVSGRAELAARPVLRAINALKFVNGGTVEVDLATAGAISKVVLVGTSSVTHSFNTSQRYQELPFAQSGARVAAELPLSASAAPPGYYLISVVDTAGVPSSAAIIALGPRTAAPPVPTLLPRGDTITLMSSNLPDSAIATDSAGLGVLKVLGANPSAADLASAQFIVRDGLADSRCVSLESAQTAGRWMRHTGYRLGLATSDGSALFKSDATFCPERGLTGAGVTLRSVNFPTYVMRHRTGQIWIDPVATSGTFSADATFTLRAAPSGIPALPSVAAPPILPGALASYTPGVSATGVQFSWDFGDGSPPTAFAASSSTSHAYALPGIYLVTLTARSADGRTATKTFVQAVYAPLASGAPRSSTALLLETRPSASARLWSVNPDNDSVSVFDADTNARVAQVTVGVSPRSVARAPDGRMWVVNRTSNSISIVDPASLAVTQTIALPRASQPHGVVFSPDGAAAFVALEATGQIVKLSPSSGAQLGILAVGGRLRHLAVNAASTRLLAPRFVTPALPGEGTASVQTTQNGAPRGGELVLVDPASLSNLKTLTLRHSDRTDSSIQGRGIPNYLGAPVIAPDAKSAWVPSKQDNVLRGTLRDGANLDFQNTVRAISSRVNLETELEAYEARVDHDNASLASAAVFHPTGAYLFVALETSRQVAVLDAIGNKEFFRLEVGRAPQALALNAAGNRLYVQNFMDRTLSVLDLDPLVRFGEFRAPLLATLAATSSERLSAQVLNGKRLFYDARDTRLSRDAYMSCASCHNDGDQDGRVWDFTGLGEGLRNTIGLRGRGGNQGLLHWSGNFDEVQDFEQQIRLFAGGTGLMTDADFNAGTRSQPLGDPKAGRSADLDALAAYVASLSAVASSPWRATNGALTTAAAAGRTVFGQAGCAECHNGSTYSDEGRTASRNVGTIKPSSGSRLGGALTGIDTPTLRDVWATAPYLHDGSAATLAAAIRAHNGVSLGTTDVDNLAAFLRELDGTEPGFAPPGVTQCATEGGTCTLPAGRTAVVYYGANQRFFSRMRVTGSIACTNATFGDPVSGVRKGCSYR